MKKMTVDNLVCAHQLNLLNDSVLLVQLDESDLRHHSFLDERILRQEMNYEWIRWSEFEAAAEGIPVQIPSYIFHVGHCGSTLLSRLVSAATGAQALREPLPMRTIAFDQADGPAALLSGEMLCARLAVFERVWARGPSKTVVKATSICTNLMGLVDPAAPIVFIYQQPETHLAVSLAGENKLQDLRGFAQNRYRRLAQCEVDMPPLAELSIGELAALTWLTEAVSANRWLMDRSVAKLDFDQFLQQPDDRLLEVCRELNLATDAGRCRTAINGPIMRSYSKAPEHEYGPGLRQEIIVDSRARNAGEIARGLRWIDRLAAASADVRSAVEGLSSGSVS
ncbi:MAG: hypothetical protein ACR2RD_07615 [Woeseiaceae bacterium]